MKTVCVVITARPSYSRVKSVLQAIDARPDLDYQIVVAASALLNRYGEVATTIDQDGFKVDARLHTVTEGGDPQCMVHTTAATMAQLATTFDRLRPDCVLTIADRYETMATAVAASYMNIPLVHLQGGEETGSIDDKVRNAITQLADLHLVSTRAAAFRVSRMRGYAGIAPGVRITGCPSIDLCARPPVDIPDIVSDGVGPKIDTTQPFIVVIQHPDTTHYEYAAGQVLTTWRAVHGLDIPALWIWPNVDAGSDLTAKSLRMVHEAYPDALIHYSRGFSPEVFLAIARKAKCIVGNSSFGVREAAYLGIPAVDIGPRQNGREFGPNLMRVGFEVEEISRAIRLMIGRPTLPSLIYGSGNSGVMIAGILAETEMRKRGAA
jgi:UDP-hydrolysing UDP-N-acetyl-D-glucosamine 2-epimerase